MNEQKSSSNQEFTLLDALPLGVCVFGEDLKILHWNRQLEEWSGAGGKVAVGNSVLLRFPLLNVPEVVGYLKGEAANASLAAEAGDLTMQFRSAGGKIRRVRLHLSRASFNDSGHHSGHAPGRRWILSFEELGDLGDTANTQKKVKERVEAAGRTKGKYLADLSHRMRTPMNGIIGMCNLLMSSAREAEQVDKLRIIHSCANNLLDIFYDFLDFSQIDAGKVELESEPLQVHSIVNEVLELHRVSAEEKALRLNYLAGTSVPEWILGDGGRLRQVLGNIVGNAVKFSENGIIEVSSRAQQKQGDTRFEIEFVIKDHGCGIDEATQKKIRTALYERSSDSGLGLVISKSLTEKMGGRLSFESEKGKGACFTASILAHATFARGSAPAQDPLSAFAIDPQVNRSLRILLVEDSRVNQLVALGLLGKLGYKADVAGDGVEAVNCFEREKYDLILMDCQMPEMDGFAATRMIREKHQGAERPRIVALTASLMKEDVERCMASGMDGVIAKPLTIHELIDALRACGSKADQPFTAKAAAVVAPLVPPESFDREKFLEAFSGIEDIAESTMKTFLLNLPQMLFAVEQSLSTKDSAALEIAAHTIKGAVAIFYAERARKIAARIEHDARDKNFTTIPEAFAELKAELHLIEPSFREMLTIKKSA